MTTKTNKKQRLKPVQVLAMRELLAGASITAAAKKAKVDRATLSQWVNSPCDFREVYLDAQAELWDEMRSGMVRVAVHSVRVVLRMLTEGDPEQRLKSALAMLKLLKLDSSAIRPHSAAETEEDEKHPVMFGNQDWREHATYLESEGWPDCDDA